MRRGWVITVAITFAILLVVLVAIPWWMPGAAAIAAQRYGVTFGGYERLGYGRFVVRAVEVHRPGLTVKVDRVEADTPLLWGWRHWRHSDRRMVAGTWSVEVQHHPTPSTAPSGWVPLRRTLRQVAAGLERWLPDAEAGAGVVRWPGGELQVNSGHWHDGQLDFVGLRHRTIVTNGTVSLERPDGAIVATVSDSAADATITLESRGAKVAGTLAWSGQRADVDAEFGEQHWMPATARLVVEDLNLPAARLGLGAAYQLLSGHVRADWRDGGLSSDVVVRGVPLEGKAAPPLDLSFRTQGDLRSVTVEDLHLSMPGGVANLTAPVTLDRFGHFTNAGAEFSVRCDLAELPWSHARGLVSGQAHVIAAAGGRPQLQFTLAADGVTIPGAEFRRAETSGTLAWPELRIDRLVLVGTGGEEMHGRGGYDVRAKQVIDASMQGTVARTTVARWLPAGVAFRTVTIDAHAKGPIADVEQGGTVTVSGLQIGALKPADVVANWRGHAAEITGFSAEATNGATGVKVEGAANPREIRLSGLAFVDRGATVLRLTGPAVIAWQPTLRVDALHLVGTDASLDLSAVWGRAGRVDAAAHGFRSQWLTDLTSVRGPEWIVPSFAFSGKWDQGPMAYACAGELAFALPEGRQATINLSMKGGPAGLVIEALHGVESGNAVVNASGAVPITVAPARRPLWSVNVDGELSFNATTVPNAAFWQQLAAMTGVEFRNPELSAHLQGTWARPTGTVTFKVDRAAMDPKRFSRPLPTIDALDVAVSGDGGGFRLERFSFRIADQLVRASGRLPVDRSTWPELMTDPSRYVQEHSELRVEVPDAEVAMFSQFLPTALAPAGRLHADLRFDHGSLGGSLRLRGAASRPLGPLGVLQQVNADVEFAAHRVLLRDVRAMAGGQPVTVTGSVELPRGGWMAGPISEPRYDIELRGQNLPFVRQSGMLVRGDLDLKLKTPAKGPPGIGGKVTLRDSLFLTDVRAYLPHGGGASAERRPPYFSIATVPLNRWTLDVDVSGTRFIRVRTPVFVGVASTHFHLGGTLGEPRAIGDATIDEGTVRMPFAGFEVTQGAVRLTEESPYEPTIYLRGTGRHFGYDLTMEVSGKASAPLIAFTSSPALAGEQVLLMVMTGAAPSNEVTTSLTHRAVQIGAFFGQSLVGSLTGGGTEPDRLTIQSGEKVSEQGKETYSIEYKLNDRWSVTGEYDEFDEYNAGFKWRLAPKQRER